MVSRKKSQQACKYNSKQHLITFSFAGIDNEEQELEAGDGTPNQVGVLDKVVMDDDAVQPPEAGDEEGGEDEGERQHVTALSAEHLGQGDERRGTEDDARQTTH